MNIFGKMAIVAVAAFLLLVLALNVWGYLALGTVTPAPEPVRDPAAYRVIMLFGATGSVGDGLLKAALDEPGVDKIYLVSRRSSPRIEAAVGAGKAELILQQDFTDYSALSDKLAEVNAVLWALGTSSVNVDDATYTRIHVDFPNAFLRQWLSNRMRAPMTFHYVTGMGTDASGRAHWAREKGRAEIELAALAEGSGLRTFGYRSGYIRPATDRAHAGHYLLQVLFQPGGLSIGAEDLAAAMLEISARPDELANGTLIDNADSIAYARAHRDYLLAAAE